MKTLQKVWLYFLVVYSFLHLSRDIMQDSGVKVFLSTVLVKKPLNPIASIFLWNSLNTYIIAVSEIVLAVFCLRRKRFGKAGLLTVVLATVVVVAWLIYWFFL